MNAKLDNVKTLLIVFFLSLSLISCRDGDIFQSSEDNSPAPILEPNIAPVANAGKNKIFVVDSLVALDGSGSSDADGNSLTYFWSFTSRPVNSSVSLSDSASITPSFVADVIGDYVLSLVVNDGALDSISDTVSITILEPNIAPVADAGKNQIFVVGSLVALDGSGSSDADGNSLTYFWSFISRPLNSSAALSNSTSIKPSFVADVVGDYVLSLKVNDGGGSESVVSEVIIVAATSVGGVIASNTNWDLINSPYLIVNDVQIAYGAILQIDADVKIIGNNGNIKVFGVLDAKGTEDAKIKFDNVNIVPGNGLVNEWFKITIDYAEMNSGSIYYATGNAVYGSILLRNSILTSIKYMYLVSPVEDCYIENNIFISSGGISTAHSDNITVYIRNNVFYQSTGDNGQEYAIKNYFSLNSSKTIVEYNSFLNTDRIALMLPSGYSSSSITAINNYWSSIDFETIEGMIYDKNDDLGSSGYILYSPFLIEPDLNTPNITPYIQ